MFVGNSNKAPPKNYSLTGVGLNRVFGFFNAISIICTTYGNGIIPEIQVNLFFFVNSSKITTYFSLVVVDMFCAETGYNSRTSEGENVQRAIGVLCSCDIKLF